MPQAHLLVFKLPQDSWLFLLEQQQKGTLSLSGASANEVGVLPSRAWNATSGMIILI